MINDKVCLSVIDLVLNGLFDYYEIMDDKCTGQTIENLMFKLFDVVLKLFNTYHSFFITP